MAIPLDPRRGQGHFRSSGRGSSRSRGIRVPETLYGISCNTRRTHTSYIGEQRWNTKASERSREAERTPSLRAGVARRRRKKKKAEAREGERPGIGLK